MKIEINCDFEVTDSEWLVLKELVEKCLVYSDFSNMDVSIEFDEKEQR